MNQTLRYVETIRTRFATDANLDAGEERDATPAEVVAYLNASPRHAVVVSNLTEASGECEAQTPQYLLRGANDGLQSFWFGPMPAEDPGDASGGDLDAEAALTAALDALCC